MDIMTMIVGGALALLLTAFVLRLFYTILINLINGKKFHHSLEQEFNKLRLNTMLNALGINKSDYIYNTKVKDIRQHMSNCSDCKNIDECDEKLSIADIDASDIEFCNNETELKELTQKQSE